MNKQERIGRRNLLKCSAAGLAAVSALSGAISSYGAADEKPAAAPKSKGPASPNGKLTVGVIGTGGLGYGHHLQVLLPKADGGATRVSDRVQVVAVCDVDSNHRDRAAKLVMERTGKRPGAYEDFRYLVDRKDIDAVLIATPDHWHTIPAVAAAEAGKDIYCEKPLTLTIDEGKALVAAVRRYDRVFQVGSQQRSDNAFRKACELVQSGAIGKLKRVDTVLHAVPKGDWRPVETPPPNLNYDFWLGQAPYVDYSPNRVHYQFRWFYAYSGGVMTDWGAHHNDIAQWANGTDGSGPVWVDGTRAKFAENGMHTVPMEFDVHYKYANGVELWCHTNNQTYDDGTKFGNGIKFTGSDGWIFVCRGNRLEASNPDIIDSEPKVRLYVSKDHHTNWLDCIESRKRCICDVEIGHRSVSICHMGNISMRLGRPLKWDPDNERFVDDEAANQMLSRPMRAPWHL